MIVKNEAHIILETLQNLVNSITFDYWVISDTGSTDGTENLILNFFSEVGIPGELHKDEWQNFAHNRNLALNAGFKRVESTFKWGNFMSFLAFK